MSVAELLEDHLETEALKAAIAAGAVQYGGHGPRASGTGFGLLHHLAGAPHESLRLCGWWQADPAAPAASLETAARNAGVELRTGVEVQRILVRDYRVAGVVLADGSELQSQLVLSSADPARTLLGLVDSIWLDPEFLHAVRSIRFRASAAFVLHALDGLPAFPGLDSPALAAGVSLTPSLDALERAADAMKYCQLAERPHVELVVPTLRWPHLAPPQQHILVARVPWVPPDLGSEGVERAVERALDAVSPGWSERLLHRLTLTPRDLEQQFGLTQGVATHGDLTLDQIFFMRPVPGWARYRMPIHGLVLCGAGTHPGPGVVGGAGVLAARMALHALRRAPRRP
jgi:phytoene dehydrogenase-like protein